MKFRVDDAFCGFDVGLDLFSLYESVGYPVGEWNLLGTALEKSGAPHLWGWRSDGCGGAQHAPRRAPIDSRSIYAVVAFEATRRPRKSRIAPAISR